MPSDKVIAEGIMQKYAEGNRKEVLGMLKRASAAARSDERDSLRNRLAIERASLRAKLQSVDREKRKERALIIRSIRTIDALLKDVI